MTTLKLKFSPYTTDLSGPSYNYIQRNSSGFVISPINPSIPVPDQCSIFIERGKFILRGELSSEVVSEATCVCEVPLKDVEKYYEITLTPNDPEDKVILNILEENGWV
jgi:hypothetical protein